MTNFLPDPLRGVYILLADDDPQLKVIDRYGNTVIADKNADWIPTFGSWIQQFNVCFFTFINRDCTVPKSFINIISNRDNIFTKNTKLIYSFGGQKWSQNNWDWLNTQQDAEKMAEQISNDPDYKNIDGIDFDLEPSVASQPGIIYFIRKLRFLNPNWIITQPVFGSSSEFSERQGIAKTIAYTWPLTTDIGNQYNSERLNTDSNLYDAISIMVYDGISSLEYIQNYSQPICTQWYCNIACAVPLNNIIVGLGGNASQDNINTIIERSNNQVSKIRGYMVWYAQADNGFNYGGVYNLKNNPDVNWLGKSTKQSIDDRIDTIFYNWSCQLI